PGELLGAQCAVLGLPVVEEGRQSLGAQARGGGLSQPPRKTSPTARGCRTHGIAQVGVERHTQLVHLHAKILQREFLPRYEYCLAVGWGWTRLPARSRSTRPAAS